MYISGAIVMVMILGLFLSMLSSSPPRLAKHDAKSQKSRESQTDSTPVT